MNAQIAVEAARSNEEKPKKRVSFSPIIKQTFFIPAPKKDQNLYPYSRKLKVSQCRKRIPYSSIERD
eukprot:CAMPEP_0194201946 /NCGR_PEP_ID=MMETSP0156-20130528/2099_1 /TAXON_ID=33649 /ORGANISM="Thalassionema nitzschioides, Strain L26-B" /LENGTH=66 /DNA_ID=CAMNT_0038927289 /DNA_START=113 /DNA_END=313 /DNA_ORIENTATION=-